MRRKLLTLLLAIATILQAIPMNIIAEQTENDYGVAGHIRLILLIISFMSLKGMKVV